MIVSGAISIVFDLGVVSQNDHHQSPLHTTSLNLVLETTPSNHRTSSSTSAQMAPPRASTPPLRMLLRSNSLVTSPSPVPTTSELPTTAARLASRHSSSPPLPMPRHTLVAPILTSGVSRAARLDTLLGSVPTPSIARTPFSTTSGRSAAVNSRVSPTPAPALIPTVTPTSVRISFNCEIVIRPLILKPLYQFHINSEPSTSAVFSGLSPTLVPIPGLGRSSRHLPSSPRTAAPVTTPVVRLTARNWLSATQATPSSTLTVTNISLRISPFCLECYCFCALGKTVLAGASTTIDLCKIQPVYRPCKNTRLLIPRFLADAFDRASAVVNQKSHHVRPRYLPCPRGTPWTSLPVFNCNSL